MAQLLQYDLHLPDIQDLAGLDCRPAGRRGQTSLPDVAGRSLAMVLLQLGQYLAHAVLALVGLYIHRHFREAILMVACWLEMESQSVQQVLMRIDQRCLPGIERQYLMQ